MQQWLEKAPSNIALIKYMGKKDPKNNLPDNPSLSYTLNNLTSTVSLEISDSKFDFWEPLVLDNTRPITLSEDAKARFLKHFAFLKLKFQVTDSFKISSNNNFPHSSGIASSASSFAALTKCAIKAFCELTNKPLPSLEEQANLSRIGSGSSCRSFFSPWVLWDGDSVTNIEIPYKKLHHEVIIINRDAKKISSSLAHELIKSSPLYKNRDERANINLKSLLKALNTENWSDAYNICWQEFQDMHQLFKTSAKSFSYINSQSEKVLKQLQNLWKKEQDGPIITMDAGPNIHLLYRMDQLFMAKEFKNQYLEGNFDVL